MDDYGDYGESFYQELERLRREKKELSSKLDSALGLLRDVATSGVSFEDERVSYVEVQIDAETWTKLQQYGVVETPRGITRIDGNSCPTCGQQRLDVERRCSFSVAVVEGGPQYPCRLPDGHEGKHDLTIEVTLCGKHSPSMMRLCDLEAGHPGDHRQGFAVWSE